MPYLLLIIEPAGQRQERDPVAGERAYADMLAFTAALQARGVLQASNSLASTNEGARVQVRGGKQHVVDGPFAEAKEIVGGFFLVDVATREEALAIAAECPAAAFATVEVRAVGPCYT